MVRELNELNTTTKGTRSLGSFKQKIKHKQRPNPVYAVEHTRTAAIEMTRMRCGNSNLSDNLFLRSLKDTPLCECGQIEDDVHYFEKCTRFNDYRLEMKALVPEAPWTTKMIYHGSETLSSEINIRLQLAGQKYIEKTCRFD